MTSLGTKWIIGKLEGDMVLHFEKWLFVQKASNNLQFYEFSAI